MKPHTLILTVGLPKSGKTTWAKQSIHPVVNPDAIRLALHGQAFVKMAEPMVWAIAETMVRHHFEYGYSTVILDATNLTPERREKWRSADWGTKFVVFDTRFATCRSRAEKSGFPVEVLDRMYASMILPGRDSFDVVQWIEED